MAMPEVPESIFMDGLKQLVDLERNWVKKGIGNTKFLIGLKGR
jgi:branched-chain amino acid aminotransferase